MNTLVYWFRCAAQPVCHGSSRLNSRHTEFGNFSAAVGVSCHRPLVTHFRHSKREFKQNDFPSSRGGRGNDEVDIDRLQDADIISVMSRSRDMCMTDMMLYPLWFSIWYQYATGSCAHMSIGYDEYCIILMLLASIYSSTILDICF